MSKKQENFNIASIFQNKHHIDRKNPFPGCYRARVEYRQDPLQLGRVKVRLPQRHGIPDVDDDAISVENLPWARRVNIGVGGYDTGSFIIPPVGSYVWVMFEAGNPSKWVYFGGVDGKDSKEGHDYGVIGDIPEDDSEIPAGGWTAKAGESEVVQDVYDGKDSNEPTVDVIHKSEKGHTIKMENKDEEESLSIIDRAGQFLGFKSYVKEDSNKTGDDSFKRKIKSVLSEDQFDYADGGDIVGNKAVVFMKDLATQVFRMVSEWTKEKIELISRSSEDKRRSILKLGGGEEDLVILMLSEDDENKNQNYIKFNPNDLNKIETGVVVEEELVARNILSDDKTSYEVWNRKFEIVGYDEDGPKFMESWEDTEDETM